MGREHSRGFWIVAATFLLVMAYATVPTPLYPLYQQRDDFPPTVITVIFAAFAVGVMLSLYLAGHVSDWLGRRRVLLVAVLVSALSAVLFLAWPEVPGLIVARLVNGISVGILAATATAFLGELRAGAKPDETPAVAATVSAGVNLGGLALGPLIGGVFADFLPAPLVLPHLVFVVVLLLSAASLLLVPETVERPETLPRWRPQRLSVPPAGRRAFQASAFGAFSGFAVFGLFTALAPTFLVVTFRADDHLLAGATTFSVFAAAAVGQIVFAPLAPRSQLTLALAASAAGLLLVAFGALVPALPVFLLGGIISGLGVGLLFRAAMMTAGRIANPERKGETLALMFLVAYTGLAVPVLLVGLALQFAPATVVLLVFAAAALGATLSAATLMRRATEPPAPQA
ncbi:MFS transporter [Subtercola boreus]|uniref:MFS transporter n=1 Tax=Subtercola boreus TaxID=120213 RepID=UPI00209BE8D5|nr:MFS transporter [Subtercola boreus]